MDKNVIVITGGAGGIGSVTAYSLKDYKLVVTDYAQEALDETVLKMKNAGLDAVGFVCDITNKASIDALVEFTQKQGIFKGLVHTAGVSGTVQNPKRVFDIDLLATDMLVQAFYEIAVENSVLILIASIMGHVIPPNPAYDGALLNPQDENAWSIIEPFLENNSDNMYNFAKRGVHLIAKHHAMKFGKKGARILSLSPGVILTPMAEKAIAEHPEQMNQMLMMTPAGRYGKPEDIAATVQFLVSDAAAFITGTDILVDGGVLTQMLKQ
ncbi:MAG: SDR family oxidoreductase [Chitinophagales bacterium]|nr:SDR family oxidoreductase [Chitinophagales bacterium]